TTINMTAPAGTGTVLVTVTNTGGSATTSYTYAGAPTVTAITPASGINTTTISITNLAGTNFAAGATVKLNRTGIADIPGTVVTVVSPTKITCTFDLTGTTAGEYNVVVTNSDNQAGMLVNGFTVMGTEPVAAFSGTPISGTVPLAVTFTDASTCTPTAWNWSFGDGTFSTLRNPSHTYTATGSYTVILNATNATPASNYLTKNNYITVSAVPVNPPSGGSNDDGSVPAPMQAYSGTISVNVGGNTPITRVTVTGTGVDGLIVTSTEVSGPGNGVTLPPGIVEEYLELTAARYSTITGAQIEFSVPQSWLDANHLTPQDIVMQHNVGSGWVALTTTFVRSENGRVYFIATSPGFSRFAITGQAHLTPQSTTVIPSPTVQTFGDITKASVTPSSVSTTARVPVAQNPVTVQTTVPPAAVSQPASGLPLATLALIGAGCVVLIGGGFLVRRWWIRRQNPALFRDYD
ncbi:MAG: PGF-pre-PGF domain-containing protein, partial [Methanoregula sp.]|nr:PGF-pre-PGF domain-containing protein [Methanoregula sp.]